MLGRRKARNAAYPGADDSNNKIGSNMLFEQVLKGMREGKRYYRKDWGASGADDYVYMGKSPFVDKTTLLRGFSEAFGECTEHAVLSWQPTIGDIMAEDWIQGGEAE